MFPLLPVLLAADAPPGPTPDPVRTPVMAVYGDSYSGAGYGGNGWNGWVQTVSRELQIDAANMAVSGSGYELFGGSSTFAFAATTNPVPGADVVVVMGSLNDMAQPPEAIRQAALVCYRVIRADNPDAALVVVGPMWPNAWPDIRMWHNRDAVRAAAWEAGAVWVDPMQEAWFAHRPDLIGPDGWHPNEYGQRHIADLLKPHIAAALDG